MNRDMTLDIYTTTTTIRHSPCGGPLVRLTFILLLMVAGVTGAWGQFTRTWDFTKTSAEDMEAMRKDANWSLNNTNRYTYQAAASNWEPKAYNNILEATRGLKLTASGGKLITIVENGSLRLT